ncbi:MAG: 2C-methyl-D-erythritol 2,4-cyclodiphosphate synthase [Pseudomonadota bacterium]|jgi:2-C-methyl-D-erythritol 4-phosphate cytidylyltransferase/2-C-methyl-D-erythritol 2,4-cyclodiphosphate synthase
MLTTPNPTPARLFALVPCGGTGARAGAGLPKQYRLVAGAPVLVHTLRALLAVSEVERVLVGVAPDDMGIEAVLARASGLEMSRLDVARCGGATRAQTVYQGLNALLHQGAQPDDWVLVHDAARCLVRPEEIQALIAACESDAVGGLLALKLPDTLKSEAQGRVVATVSRQDKWLAQTPQMFRIRDLYYALALGEADGFAAITDEASAIEGLGLKPLLVTGRADNIKLTYPDDFALADAVLKAREGAGQKAPSSPSPSHSAATKVAATCPWRMGEGWDCHALVPGRKLILGGVNVPHTHGLLGHSDADVLLHAITDALLGAAGLGDIGRHFPDTDARFKGVDSGVLLAEAMARVRAAGWELVNLDCTIVAQAPKLSPHIPQMQTKIAATLGVVAGQINVKAKTAEKLGPVGQGLSLEARAVALLGQMT